MKVRYLLIGFTVLFIVGLLTTSSSAKIDPKNIAGLWLFDDGKGDTAMDSSGNKSDGKLVGGPKWVDGKFGKALDFDGVDDGVNIPNNDSLNNLSDITILAWVYLRRGATSGWNSLVGKNPYINGYLIWIETTQPAGLVYAGGTRFDNRSGVPMDLTRWYHLASTRSVTGEMKFYIDGVLIHTATSSAGPISDNASPLAVGGQSPQVVDGLIDDVAVFNVPLAVQDIQTLMNKGLKETIKPSAVDLSGKLAATWASIKAR